MNLLTQFLNPEKVIKPVFIVGCGRSGTTLLFDLLSQHPDLVRTSGYPDGEDHEGWIKHGGCVMAGIGNVHSDNYGNGRNGFYACLHMTGEDVSPDTLKRMRGYYWQDVLKKNKNKRVLNKCPHNSNKLEYVLKIFPDAKIIHIVRDCEPVVRSWVSIMKDHPSLTIYWPEEDFPCFWLMEAPSSESERKLLMRHKRFFPGGGEELFADYWIKTNEGISRQMAGREKQLHRIRYEDLVSKPGEQLKALSAFCELSAYDFDTGSIKKNTALRHSGVLSERLRQTLKLKAAETRKRFGYDAEELAAAVSGDLDQ